jgi:hypothetical protein
VYAEHAWLAGAVDVGIQDADPGTLGGQCQCKVDCDGGLADTALAGSHGDDVADAFDMLDALLRGVRGDLAGDIDDGGLDTGNGFDQRLQPGGEIIAVTRGREAQHDLHGRLVTVDADLLDALGRNQVLLKIGIDIGSQLGFNLVFAHVSHDSLLDSDTGARRVTQVKIDRE